MNYIHRALAGVTPSPFLPFFSFIPILPYMGFSSVQLKIYLKLSPVDRLVTFFQSYLRQPLKAATAESGNR